MILKLIIFSGALYTSILMLWQVFIEIGYSSREDMDFDSKARNEYFQRATFFTTVLWTIFYYINN